MKLSKNHRKVEKALNHLVFWQTNLTGYYNNDNGSKAYVELKYNVDNSVIKVGVQDFDISNQFTYFYLEV